MANQFHLADLFETTADTVGDRVAILSDKGPLTYTELNQRADRLAAGLAAQGIKRGDKVGLYLMNCPEYIEAFLAAMKLGAVPFNVNYRYRAEELCYLFNNSDCVVIFHGAEFSDIVRDISGDAATLKLYVAVDDGSAADSTGSLDYDDLMATTAAGPFERDESDLLLLYTGGTTGMPKGVMWPHKAFFYACLNGAGHFHPAGPITAPEEIEGRARDGYQMKMFTLAPLMHGAAIWSAWSALLGGLTLVLDPMRSFDSVAIWDRVEREGVNIVQIVGDAMAMPMKDALKANPDRWNLATVVNFGSGGAVFSQHLKDEIKSLLPNAMITDGMGSSETGISGMAEPSADGMMRLPYNDDQKLIADRRFAGVGETGLIARSGHIPIGYYGDAEKTAESFQMIEGRLWAITGDQGRLDEGQMITVFGRGSTCINSGGEKIFPEEVEEALRAHPAVVDAVVAGQADDRWGERVVAIVSQRVGLDEPDFQDVHNFLAERLAGYKLPKALIWLPEIKRSPAGKQDYGWAKEIAASAERETA
jgi:acyl-CoA synthetase (AMP-forming)/AMP-acid ligase II